MSKESVNHSNSRHVQSESQSILGFCSASSILNIYFFGAERVIFHEPHGFTKQRIIVSLDQNN